MKKALAVLTLAVLSPLANAGGYIGGNYAAIEYTESGLDPELSLGAISVIGGYRFNEYIAIEARAGFGAGDDSYNGVKLELDSYYGAYAKLGMPIENFYPYILAGYTRGELTLSAMGFSISDSDSDISYGIGLGYQINQNFSLNAEYSNLLDKDGVTLDGFSIGVNYAF
ncbi:hypothetical protein NFHSH190041_36370 [Shewanella sp. NFH-SH190041]|uniref:porin family protein n=1 Tax=Shewanella sp. NFH-SH190041 TaxID=2950245 RepID=UPI0021C2D5EF|nr:porin family protein [Shewanella sp. NFH-SH190041]BDM66185.1 hypothetical protein NFHSH190041_36370 [Shewanella sp. NFH-SH190041]